MKHSTSLPVLVVVAVVALVLGSFGSAAAGGLTKKSVKKIATKVVTKQAPALSVARARTADTASDASGLGGLAPAAYLDRVAYAASSGTVGASASTPTALLPPLSITVPAGVGFLHASGAVSLIGGSGNASAWVQLDSTTCAGSGPSYDVRQLGNGAQQSSVPVDYVFAVASGVHTVTLCGTSATSSAMYHPNLSIETVQGAASGP